MFLTAEELQELTGYCYKKLQIKWLLQRGYKFEISATGSPKVLKLFVEEMLGAKKVERAMKAQPNFSNSKFFG
jgi:hypothetical protein